MKTLRIVLVAMALVASFGACKKKDKATTPAATEPAAEETAPAAEGGEAAPAAEAPAADATVTP